jgi:hypothetical protein
MVVSGVQGPKQAALAFCLSARCGHRHVRTANCAPSFSNLAAPSVGTQVFLCLYFDYRRLGYSRTLPAHMASA